MIFEQIERESDRITSFLQGREWCVEPGALSKYRAEIERINERAVLETLGTLTRYLEQATLDVADEELPAKDRRGARVDVRHIEAGIEAVRKIGRSAGMILPGDDWTS